MRRLSRIGLLAGFVISVGTIALLNHYQASERPTLCDDCGLHYGVPFTHYISSGWDNSGYVWAGALGNLGVTLAFAFVLGWLFDRLSQSHRR